MPCLWCDEPLATGRHGSAKVFCSSTCRSSFHTATRRWADGEVMAGRLRVADIRSESRKACTLAGAEEEASPLPHPLSEDIARYEAALTTAREVVLEIPISAEGVAELCAYGWL